MPTPHSQTAVEDGLRRTEDKAEPERRTDGGKVLGAVGG